MPRLAEIQFHFRQAVIDGDVQRIAPMLVGGREPASRLSVHQRNYETSLVDALLVKFPATGWLIGTPFLTEMARHFVHDHPPQAPCIAEYGAGFPALLSKYGRTERVPYLRDFAELEWHVGQVAIAVDAPPMLRDAFSIVAPEALPAMRLTLQPGLHYLRTLWPVDELLKLYLTETAPDRLELTPAEVWIEVRGARGQFQFSRLRPAEFTFRKSIAEGHTAGEAADLALDVDETFEPGQSLAALIADGLIT